MIVFLRTSMRHSITIIIRGLVPLRACHTNTELDHHKRAEAWQQKVELLPSALGLKEDLHYVISHRFTTLLFARPTRKCNLLNRDICNDFPVFLGASIELQKLGAHVLYNDSDAAQ